MNENEIKIKVLEENEKMHDLYAKDHTRSVPYQHRKATRTYIWKLILRELKNVNVEIKNSNILEVACGTGTFVKLAEKYNANYYGIDISSNMIDIAKNNNKYKNASFEKISLEEFYMKHPKEYDIIISSSFLHHLYDMEEGLIQICSMLKDNGVYIALHEEIINRPHTKIEILDKQLSFLFGYEGHIRYSTKRRIERFINFLFKKPNNDDIIYEDSDGTNWIDYQMNFNFNLIENDIAKKYGKVVPYCYYTFPKFRYIQKVNNNCMFVMRAEQSRAEQSYKNVA